MIEQTSDHFGGQRRRNKPAKTVGEWSGRTPADPVKLRRQRRIALLILLFTIAAIAFFWAKDIIGSIWNNINQPSTFEIIPPARSEENITISSTREVIDKIGATVKNLQGKYGVYVYSFDRNESYGINQDDTFLAASVNKIPIMLAFYREIEKGSISPTSQYKLSKADIQEPGTGSMQYQPVGTVYTYRELLSLCGKQSDNTAAHVLALILGKQKLNQFNQLLGLSQTSMDDNLSTPHDIGKLFQMVWEGGLLKTDNYRTQFFNDLTNTQFEDRIPAGVGAGVTVAHKIGTAAGSYHDCGIVFADSPFVLCIMSKDVVESEALKTIPEIAHYVWEYEKQQN